MDKRETLTPSSGDAILKRHLFSEVARNWIKGRGHIERAYFVRRPSRQSFGFRVAASSGPIPKAPGSAGGYLSGGTGRGQSRSTLYPRCYCRIEGTGWPQNRTVLPYFIGIFAIRRNPGLRQSYQRLMWFSDWMSLARSK